MATPQAALAAAYESWNAGDLDGYLSLYDEGIALHGYSPEPMNKDQVRGFYQGIFSAFGTPKLEFHEVLWDGDVASIRFTMTGRHVDEFMGVPASGTSSCCPASPSCTSAATVSSSVSPKRICWTCLFRLGPCRRRPEPGGGLSPPISGYGRSVCLPAVSRRRAGTPAGWPQTGMVA